MNNKNDQAKAKEIWVPAQFITEDRTIEMFPGYEVSNLGRVKSLNYNHTEKSKVMKHGRIVRSHGTYYQVPLRRDKKLYWRTVHRLVLSSFCSKDYFNGAVIDHIDSNPSNNRLRNLRWVTQQENSSTSHRSEALSKSLTNRADRSKQVRVTFLDDGHCEVFPSAHEAERALGIPMCIVPNCIRRHNGYYKKLNVLFEYV